MKVYTQLSAASVAAVQEYVRLGGSLLLGGHFWGSEGQYTDPGGRSWAAWRLQLHQLRHLHCCSCCRLSCSALD